MAVSSQTKETILVANKVDNTERVPHASEFYALGMGEPYTVSAISGKGTGEVLDKITSLIKDGKEDEEDPNLPRFAVVGKPNVGKSSLVNSLVGEERNIVTDIAGTTRDSINSRYNAYNLERASYLSMTTVQEKREEHLPKIMWFPAVVYNEPFDRVSATIPWHHRPYDIVFIGNNHNGRNRIDILNRLHTAGIRIHVWGNGWEGAAFAHHPPCSILESFQIYQKIVYIT